MALIHTSRTHNAGARGGSSARAGWVSSGVGAPRALPRRSVVGAKHIRKREVIPFTRQSAGMLNAGMSIVATIGALQEQTEHRGFKTLLGSIRTHIESGLPFSEVLAQYPSIFSEMYVNMVRAGERSGQFAEIMRRLAILLDSSARLVRKVKSALTYPVVILCLALTIAFGLITFVVPVFKEMFEGFGSELPGPTQALVNLSEFIVERWAYLLAAGIVLTYGVRLWGKTAGGRRTLHRAALKLPVFGPLILKVVIARYTRLLGQMLTSGVPILDAMSITARATGNVIIERSIMNAREQVEKGETLSDAMEGQPFLPTLMVRMTGAGEKSGRLDEMLTNVADAYDDEVETLLSTLTSLLEPFLMILLGIIIGSIVVAMFLPIFKIGTVVGG